MRPHRHDAPREPIERLQLGRGASVLSEHRGRGCSVRDFADAFPAEPITAGHAPVQAVERFRVAGMPLFWFRPDSSAVVVDAAHALDLTVADATRLQGRDEVRVGRFTPAAVAALGPRELVKLLLFVEAIRTYWHTDADLRLEAERREGGAYEADFAGVHHYYTNEKNEAPLSFAVRVGADGTVSVRARAAGA